MPPGKPIAAPKGLDPELAIEAVVASLSRAGVALGRAAFEPAIRAPEHAKRAFGDDRGVQTILRAASSPASTTTAGWASELAHVTTLFLASLVGASAGVELLGRGIQLRFAGDGSISLPTIAIGSGATFIGQGKPIPVVSFPTSAGVKLEPHKLALIATLTREMVESSNAEVIVRATLSESAARGLDAALFSTSAGSADQPPGLLYNVAPMTPAPAGEKTTAMLSDLSALIGAVARAAGNSPVAVVAAPEQATAIALRTPKEFTYALAASSTLAAGTVIAVAANALASGFDPVPEITASREPELVMDTAPGDPGGTQQTMTMFQGDRLALKLKMRATWALRSTSAIAYMTNVTW
jgi:hypothetical protein